MPKVSVVVPVYNVECYLKKTLETLRSQTLADIEFILVDDGSLDRSGEICDEYALLDSRFRVLHKKNGGVSSARNIGMENACGDYIGFCDADDLPHTDLYETLYELCQKNSADMASVKSRIIYEDGHVHSYSCGKGLISRDSREDMIKDILKGETGFGIFKFLLSSDIARKLRFDTELKINEDKKFVLDAALTCDKFVHLDEVKYDYYRRQNSSSCSEFSEKFFDGLKVSEYIFERVQREYPALTDYALADRINVSLWTLKIMILENGKKDFPSEWKRQTAFLRQFGNKFCKTYLDRNTYAKWLALKIGDIPFTLLIRACCIN
ncbi:MAG: glycosyltransferase family 2 protein [Oscillospiraceae bacterium]